MNLSILLRKEYIFRMAGVGIVVVICEHAAEFIFGIYLMSHSNCKGTCHKLMMHCLIACLLVVVCFIEHSGAEYSAERLGEHIDLVEGQPVFHSAFVTFKENFCKAQVEVNQYHGGKLQCLPCFYNRIGIHLFLNLIYD